MSALQILNISAEGGRIDPGLIREFDKRRPFSRTDPYQKTELLGRQPERLEAGIVITRERARRCTSLEAWTLCCDDFQRFWIKTVHIYLLDNPILAK